MTYLVLYLLALPVYIGLSWVLGATWGPRMGEPNLKILWTVWLPVYGPFRLLKWWANHQGRGGVL